MESSLKLEYFLKGIYINLTENLQDAKKHFEETQIDLHSKEFGTSGIVYYVWALSRQQAISRSSPFDRNTNENIQPPNEPPKETRSFQDD